jgi:hypothetical protein
MDEVGHMFQDLGCEDQATDFPYFKLLFQKLLGLLQNSKYYRLYNEQQMLL